MCLYGFRHQTSVYLGFRIDRTSVINTFIPCTFYHYGNMEMMSHKCRTLKMTLSVLFIFIHFLVMKTTRKHVTCHHVYLGYFLACVAHFFNVLLSHVCIVKFSSLQYIAHFMLKKIIHHSILRNPLPYTVCLLYQNK